MATGKKSKKFERHYISVEVQSENLPKNFGLFIQDACYKHFRTSIGTSEYINTRYCFLMYFVLNNDFYKERYNKIKDIHKYLFDSISRILTRYFKPYKVQHVCAMIDESLLPITVCGVAAVQKSEDGDDMQSSDGHTKFILQKYFPVHNPMSASCYDVKEPKLLRNCKPDAKYLELPECILRAALKKYNFIYQYQHERDEFVCLYDARTVSKPVDVLNEEQTTAINKYLAIVKSKYDADRKTPAEKRLTLIDSVPSLSNLKHAINRLYALTKYFVSVFHIKEENGAYAAYMTEKTAEYALIGVSMKLHNLFPNITYQLSSLVIDDEELKQYVSSIENYTYLYLQSAVVNLVINFDICIDYILKGELNNFEKYRMRRNIYRIVKIINKEALDFNFEAAVHIALNIRGIFDVKEPTAKILNIVEKTINNMKCFKEDWAHGYPQFKFTRDKNIFTSLQKIEVMRRNRTLPYAKKIHNALYLLLKLNNWFLPQPLFSINRIQLNQLTGKYLSIYQTAKSVDEQLYTLDKEREYMYNYDVLYSLIIMLPSVIRYENKHKSADINQKILLNYVYNIIMKFYDLKDAYHGRIRIH